MFQKAFDYIAIEHIFLILAALAFSGLAILLIHWNASGEHIGAFLTIANGLIGALLRGLVGNGRTNNANPVPEKKE
jgi:hypothetical protein